MVTIGSINGKLSIYDISSDIPQCYAASKIGQNFHKESIVNISW